MHSGVWEQVVYWLDMPVLALLAGVLLWRKLPKGFPFFFTYIVISCLVDATRLIAYHLYFENGSVTHVTHDRIYGNIYWISDLVRTVFVFLATYELFMTRLFPRFYKIRFYRFLFSSACMVITVLAALTAIQSTKVTILIDTNRIFDFLRVALLFFFVALMLFMGRGWSKYEFGIALGLSVHASAWLLTFVTFFGIWNQPDHMPMIVKRMPIIAYDVACLIWLIYFLKPERSNISEPAAWIDSKTVQDARKMEETLKTWLIRKKHVG